MAKPDEMERLPHLLGMVATTCFTLQYAPQAWKNYERKSVEGFSTTGILIKLVGAAFLMVNSYFKGETVWVVLYGVFNVIQHSLFMIQFAEYTERRSFLVWLGTPIVPLFLSSQFPETIPATSLVKPLAQVFSHIPQLVVCYKQKTTGGVSLMTHHLNCVGGFSGLLMCILHPPAQNSTYFLYVNSIMQAVTIYAFAIYYGELTLADVLAFVAPMKGGGKGKGHDDVGAGESSEKELESQSEPLLRNTTHAKSTTRSDVHIV